MPRSETLRFEICCAVILLFALSLLAQTNGNAPLQFQVSSAQPWTDTGIDLQPGDSVQISAIALTSASGPACDPAGASDGNAQSSNLPLPGAAAGALIARFHAQGALPILVGRSATLQIQEASHLFIGMNSSGTAGCQGGFSVTVQKNAALATAAAASAPQTRGAQLKSQLANAAQVFMSGQFGIGKSAPTGTNAAPSAAAGATDATTNTPVLNISNAALDSDLRRSLDSLPRRVNDQLNNLGDMVNFVIIGAQQDVQASLEAASWHAADTDNRRAAINAAIQTYGSKDYLAMPMSTLYLFGRKQDFGYELAEPIAMVASRHHFRIWKAPFTYGGQEVWVGAGTHDIGFAKDKRNNNVTHKIDSNVDGERDNIGISLQKANKVKSLTYYLPPDPVQDARNATGDEYHSDGRLLVIFLQ